MSPRRWAADDLARLGASADEVALFAETFPTGMTSGDVPAALEEGLDVEWLVWDVVPDDARRVYDATVDDAGRVYWAARADALRAYEAAKADAWRVYEAALAEPWRVYCEAMTTALVAALRTVEEAA